MLAVDRPARSITVSHRAIPKRMPAMAMPFHVERPDELAGLEPGSRVEFRVSGSMARHIRVQTARSEGLGDGEKLELKTPPERVAIGQAMPDFTLTDHDGRPVRLSDFRGRMVAVNFIYTRCPLPEVCPRLSAGFARVQRRFAERMGRDLILLSLTLDPQFDTPEVLSKYARTWRSTENWRFLTGSLDEIRRVATRFGLVFWPEEGLLVHTSSTGVIARDGTLAALVEGSSYDPQQLCDLIETVLEKR